MVASASRTHRCRTSRACTPRRRPARRTPHRTTRRLARRTGSSSSRATTAARRYRSSSSRRRGGRPWRPRRRASSTSGRRLVPARQGPRSCRARHPPPPSWYEELEKTKKIFHIVILPRKKNMPIYNPAHTTWRCWSRYHVPHIPPFLPIFRPHHQRPVSIPIYWPARVTNNPTQHVSFSSRLFTSDCPLPSPLSRPRTVPSPLLKLLIHFPLLGARAPPPPVVWTFSIFITYFLACPRPYIPPCPPDTAPRSAAGKTPARISEPVVYSRNSACVPLTPSICLISVLTIFVYVSVLLSPIDDLIQDKKYLPALQCMLFFLTCQHFSL